ncbi:MAG: TRAP transporter substrate-binding protein [Acetobacteraceae bacterium]|nr:TRAP transporter substrate-binding protein [Acetobacteraceae bacterium]
MPFPPDPPSRSRPRRAACLGAVLALLAALLVVPALAQGGGDPIRLRIVGGLASLSQYVDFEEPFWTKRVPEITKGRVRAEIAPFDRSGIRGQETLQLMRLGVVPFGYVLLGLAAADEPLLNVLDLPVMNTDIAALRRTVELGRPGLAQVLRERYNVELLAIYTYPAQVMFCRRPFSGLSDLAGRRIRTSSVGQSELVQALGGVPVVIPLAETVQAIRTGVVECAITGTLSGNAIGLHEVTSHVSRLAISWGVSFFGANVAAWQALPPDVREDLRRGLRELEREVWEGAEQQTEEGLACLAGRPACRGGRPGRMSVVEERWQDESRRLQLLNETILPSWLQRCGPECTTVWNRDMAPTLGLWARTE